MKSLPWQTSGAANSAVVYPDSLPWNGSNFESLDQKKLTFYLQHIQKDPDLPKTRMQWEKKLKALGLLIDEGFKIQAQCCRA